eukprot:TRINITY_DN6321_c0_g4_i1.p1 TRINITY_DN6321_c0_g4~~TRINITY_DN6321_c0_g4_i1.p1  ORF type:complete len:515 (+),score=137.89 TRINITY_DN6321_c0_g4_i1:212-1756(+)
MKALKSVLKKKPKGDKEKTRGASPTARGGYHRLVASEYASSPRRPLAPSSTGSSRRRKSTHQIHLQKPGNPEGKLNPMNAFDYLLAHRGWPRLLPPKCPIPHAVYTVSDQKPTDEGFPNVAIQEAESDSGTETQDGFAGRDRTRDGLLAEYRVKVSRFYALNDPAKKGLAKPMMERAAVQGYGRAELEGMWRRLLAQYGLTERTWDPATREERLMKFYSIHAPEELGKVPDILKVCERGEAAFDYAWQHLLRQYGVDDGTWDRVVDWRSRFATFYYIHAREKVETVPEILARLEATNRNPRTLWEMMLAKYGVNDETWLTRAAAEDGGEVDWYARYTAFYDIYVPDRVETVAEVLRLIEDRGATPAEMWPAMLREYGVDEDTWFDHPRVPPTPPEAAEEEWATKFKQLFEIHAPEMLPIIPELLSQGSHAQVWALMLAQYKLTEHNWNKPRPPTPPASPPPDGATTAASPLPAVGSAGALPRPDGSATSLPRPAGSAGALPDVAPGMPAAASPP